MIIYRENFFTRSLNLRQGAKSFKQFYLAIKRKNFTRKLFNVLQHFHSIILCALYLLSNNFLPFSATTIMSNLLAVACDSEKLTCRRRTYVFHQSVLQSYPKRCFAGQEAPFAQASVDIEIVIWVWLHLIKQRDERGREMMNIDGAF